jgi:SAM-dependent methyltransferase
MTFTAHNIILDDGTPTKPDSIPFVQVPRFLAVERCLKALYPNGLSGIRVADLACLEGGYAVGLARMGIEVLGIEIRRLNYDNSCFVKERVNLPNLRFVQDNVWNIETYAPFDVILCSGIFYHLDQPKRFLDIMARCVRKAVLLNTHFATVAPIAKFGLSDLEENEGLPGRWFKEGPPRNEDGLWASWDNERSFWIQKEFLLQAIRDAGFTMVFEQYDWLGDRIADSMLSGPYKEQNRNLFVGVKV